MRRLPFAAIAAAFSLAACSGQPSEADITQAAGTYLAEMSTIIASAAARPLQVDDLEKHGCTVAEGSGYRCDVTMTISGGHLPAPQTRTAPLTLTKGGDGWIARE